MSKLSEDLVLIRKNMRLSKQNVFEKCRIPLVTIEAIEDGSIFSGKTRNKTYLRSYFRTYAKAIGIRDDDMIQALNELETNRYDGSLAEKYLELKENSSEDNASSDPEKASATKSESDKKSQKDLPTNSDNISKNEPEKKSTGKQDDADSKTETSGSSNDKESPAKHTGERKTGAITTNTSPETGYRDPTPDASKKKSITPENQEKTLEDVEWEDKSLKKTLFTSTSQFASAESREPDVASQELPPPPDLNAVDWATKVKEAVYRPQRNRLLWVIIVIILALLLATTFIYWYWQQEEITVNILSPTEDGPPTVTGTPAVPSEDERASGEISPPPEQLAPDPALEADEDAETPDEEASGALTPEDITTRILENTGTGDTLHVAAYALHGNLEPIRIHSDVFSSGDDTSPSFSPYWVEHHQAMQFEFIDEITFQGALSRMVLIFNGHIIDDFSDLYLDGPRITLTRDFIMEHEELQTPPETPFTEIPPPRSVVNRPRFSP